MNRFILCIAASFVLAGLAAAACNDSGLSSKPRANFTDLSCLDVNGDGRINAGDAADASELPDFNADDDHDADDAAFVEGVDIPLHPPAVAEVCAEDAPSKPEYLVSHDFLRSSDVSCVDGERAFLVMGIGGGVDDLEDKAEAAGIRSIVNAALEVYDDRDVQTIGIVSGPAIEAAANAHAGMEDWLTNVVRVHLDRFTCLNAIIIGHSHGAVTAEVITARLEATHADRFVATVALDRIESLYNGDVASHPSVVPLVNVYQRNNGELGGVPVEASSVDNIDVSAEEGPRDGHDGGPGEQVNHVTVDNSTAVRDIIVSRILEKSGMETAQGD